MAKIIKLDKHISDKIAAGEVIENPAAVIKELVENSIDANAKKITIEVKNAGKSYIRVTDNGDGIDKDDVILAFDRHATSKIKSVNDIYRINTLGFRGEALPSIASVSRLEMVTKTAMNDAGYKVSINGGKLVSSDPVGAKKGTTVIVKDLFYNTPARMKFLKRNSAEQRRINKLVNRLALSHSEISFKYIKNNEVKFVTPGKGNLQNVILSIFDKKMAKNTMKVESSLSNIELNGYISNLAYTRGNSSLQIFFVNGRYVESDLIKESIQTAYKTLIPIKRYPICFLNFKIDPEEVDVNIHPSKTEIKFSEKGLIKQLVYTSIRSKIMSYDQTPSVSLEENAVFEKALNRQQNQREQTKKSTDDKLTIDSPKSSLLSKKQTREVDKNPFKRKEKFSKPSTSKRKTIPKEAEVKNPIDLNIFDVDFDKLEKGVEEKTPKKLEKEETIYDQLKIIGQLFDSYILSEKDNKLYLIDQHAAHEKVMYEKLVENYKNDKMISQILLSPITIDVTYNEKEYILENQQSFEKLGFLVEDFGKNALVIREVPILFNEPISISLVESIFYDFKKNYSGRYDLVVEDIIEKSCKSAIKANDQLSSLEIEELIKLLKKLESPYTCPHGRPIIISISKDEIEKKFKRK